MEEKGKKMHGICSRKVLASQKLWCLFGF